MGRASRLDAAASLRCWTDRTSTEARISRQPRPIPKGRPLALCLLQGGNTMTRYLYLTAGTLDCTGALDGWTITSPTARACAPDDDLLLRRGDVITLDGEVYRPAGYRPSTYDERLVSASVERPVWVRIGRMAGRPVAAGAGGRPPDGGWPRG